MPVLPSPPVVAFIVHFNLVKRIVYYSIISVFFYFFFFLSLSFFFLLLFFMQTDFPLQPVRPCSPLPFSMRVGSQTTSIRCYKPQSPPSWNHEQQGYGCRAGRPHYQLHGSLIGILPTHNGTTIKKQYLTKYFYISSWARLQPKLESI